MREVSLNLQNSFPLKRYYNVSKEFVLFVIKSNEKWYKPFFRKFKIGCTKINIFILPEYICFLVSIPDHNGIDFLHMLRKAVVVDRLGTVVDNFITIKHPVFVICKIVCHS